jgi:hypothetical protein
MQTFETGLTRVFKGPTYTIGKFHFGETFFCDILEDTVRDKNNDGDLDDPGETKVWGETAIPIGRYEIVRQYSPHFKRDMPYLVGVRYFTGIMMHWGTTAIDTHGCLLVGVNSEKGKVLGSRVTFDALWVKFTTAWDAGKRVYITVR